MAATTRIDATEVGSVIVLTLVGEHDLSTRPCLADAVQRLARPGARMVIDLTPATFIDSTILAALVAAVRNADSVAIVAPSGGMPRRLVDLTGASVGSAVCETADQALRHVICQAEPRDAEDAARLLSLADQLLDLAWQTGDDTSEPLAVARKLSQMIGREPLIEDVKLLIADAQHCTPSEAFERLVHVSQQENQKIADLARGLAERRGDGSPAPTETDRAPAA